MLNKVSMSHLYASSLLSCVQSQKLISIPSHTRDVPARPDSPVYLFTDDSVYMSTRDTAECVCSSKALVLLGRDVNCETQKL
jgi:hypothetical protein